MLQAVAVPSADPSSTSRMTNNKRVLNTTRNFSMKFKQAVKAVQECACAWVVYGETVRDVKLDEAIRLRSAQPKKTVEPLPMAELPRTHFKPPAYATPTMRERQKLVHAANMLFPKPEKKPHAVAGVA